MFDDIRIGPQWQLRPEEIRSIASVYGLSVAEDTIQALGGATNGVVRVGSDQGEVVVRVHRPWTTPERLASVHRIQHQLRERGLPIPRVLTTRLGTTWTTLRDRLVEVMAYVPHDGPADTWARMEVAFALLGRLHTALAGLSPSDLIAPPYSSYAAPRTALTMLQETEHTFRTFRGQEGYAAAAPVRSATYDLVRGLVTERERYESSLPFSIVHGDYGTDNVLMCGGTVVAILDFDFMAYRERVFQLAYALNWTLDRLHVPAEGAPYSDSALKRAAGLLRRYATTATPLTDGEIEALPFEMARVPLYPIVEAGYTTDAPYTSGPLAQTLAFARHVPVARWLVSEAVRVRRTLAT